MKLIAYYPGTQGVPERPERNWREHYINEGLYYSHRSTDYEKSNYPSTLHYHDYYELLVYVRGDVHYICESENYRPQLADVILVPPGLLHMSMMNGEKTHYERHVFYLYPDALDAIGASALLGFLQGEEKRTGMSVLCVENKNDLLSLLAKLEGALDENTPAEAALALSRILQIFYAVNRADTRRHDDSAILPQSVLEIQRYIDENFAEIRSVSDVASHFYYSREYMSRLFKQYFNTTVADYLRKRRIAYSCALMAQGMPLGDVCFAAGFENLSTFIRSFRAVTGMTPSAYRTKR